MFDEDEVMKLYSLADRCEFPVCIRHRGERLRFESVDDLCSWIEANAAIMKAGR